MQSLRMLLITVCRPFERYEEIRPRGTPTPAPIAALLMSVGWTALGDELAEALALAVENDAMLGRVDDEGEKDWEERMKDCSG